ncbi:hypothetical protein P879_01451 [Paragonimus westermani]|uniref:LIM zinc-binding domain-containing protein n=1 Tax=Paragonimus westermani TaxID=34504 RepID=A0A8T0DA00_9TREM|nr:hypothetical protein P879_01451 [Paragonimus westermani]
MPSTSNVGCHLESHPSDALVCYTCGRNLCNESCKELDGRVYCVNDYAAAMDNRIYPSLHSAGKGKLHKDAFSKPCHFCGGKMHHKRHHRHHWLKRHHGHHHGHRHGHRHGRRHE